MDDTSYTIPIDAELINKDYDDVYTFIDTSEEEDNDLLFE